MTIETKFDRGNEVWILETNKLAKGRIKSINVKVGKGDEGEYIDISYGVELSVNLVSTRNESEVGSTPEELFKKIKDILEDIQNSLFNKAKKFLNSNIVEAKDWNDFAKKIKNRKLIKAFFCGNVECEDYIKDKTEGATSRLIPLQQPKKIGKCIHCNKEGKFLVYFAKAY